MAGELRASAFKTVIAAKDKSEQLAIDWFRPSPDGGLSPSRCRIRTARVAACRSMTLQTEKRPARQFHACSCVRKAVTPPGPTMAAGSGIPAIRARNGRKADRSFYQQVYFHRLGSDWKNDPLVLDTAHGLPHVAIITLNSDHLRGSAIAKVQYRNGGQYAHFLLDREKAIPFAGFNDGFDAVATGPNGALYALSYANAPNGKIVRFAPPFPPSGLRGGILTVPESNVAIEHGHTMRALTLTHSHLLVREIDGGSNRVRIFGHAGEPKGDAPAAGDGRHRRHRSACQWRYRLLGAHVSAARPGAALEQSDG